LDLNGDGRTGDVCVWDGVFRRLLVEREKSRRKFRRSTSRRRRNIYMPPFYGPLLKAHTRRPCSRKHAHRASRQETCHSSVGRFQNQTSAAFFRGLDGNESIWPRRSAPQSIIIGALINLLRKGNWISKRTRWSVRCGFGPVLAVDDDGGDEVGATATGC
jgi:hypothetical protein